MAKLPVAGGVKTRLAREIGVARATRLCAACGGRPAAACRFRPALANHPRCCARLRGAQPSVAARIGAPAAGRRRSRRPYAAHLRSRARGADADRRHGRAGHQACAHRRGISSARPPRCGIRSGDGWRLLAGRPAAASARAASLCQRALVEPARTCRYAGQPRRAVPWRSSPRCSDVDSASDLRLNVASLGRRVLPLPSPRTSRGEG